MANRQLQQIMRHIRKLAGAHAGGENNDGQLLERFVAQGDEAAFADLLERHGPLVLGVCRRVLHDVHLADDAFQATFLVLARKAGTLRKRDQIGTWLYSVARRVAGKARARVAQRQEQEKEMPNMGNFLSGGAGGEGVPAHRLAAPDSTTEADWRELRPLLDEAVDGLPEKYREPFVLCCLEGKSQAEAARQLGWPEGTVSGRLARARERLRTRLSRRGLALSTGALSTLVAQNATAAAVPTALFCSTTQAAMGILAASTVAGAGGVSALTAALMEGVLHEMFLTKIKIAALLLLSVAFAGGTTGIVAHRVLAGKQPGAGPATAQGADPAKPPAKETYYVAKTGSDSDPGSEAKPWATLRKAAEMAKAGDTVLIKEGSYDERVTVKNSGVAGKKIVFQSSPRRSVSMRGFAISGKDYVRIEGFRITTDETGIDIRGGSHVEVVDNDFYEVKKAIIHSSANSAYIANNHASKVQFGIGVSGKDWLVEGNEIERLFDYGTMGDCDYSRFWGENGTFRNNYFHGTKREEIGKAHVDGFQTYAVHEGEYAKNIVIERNTVCDFGQGVMAEGKSGTHENLVLRNNIFNRGAAWGLCFHGYKNVTVVNNVFANMGIHSIGFLKSKKDSTKSTGTVRNNIFYDSRGYWVDGSSTVEGGFNLFYGKPAPTKGQYQDKDILDKDPLFVDPGKEDFRLGPGSPAIDAGMNVGVKDDRLGIFRPQGKGYDIGAHEYGPPPLQGPRQK